MGRQAIPLEEKLRRRKLAARALRQRQKAQDLVKYQQLYAEDAAVRIVDTSPSSTPILDHERTRWNSTVPEQAEAKVVHTHIDGTEEVTSVFGGIPQVAGPERERDPHQSPHPFRYWLNSTESSQIFSQRQVALTSPYRDVSTLGLTYPENPSTHDSSPSSPIAPTVTQCTITLEYPSVIGNNVHNATLRLYLGAIAAQETEKSIVP